MGDAWGCPSIWDGGSEGQTRLPWSRGALWDCGAAQPWLPVPSPASAGCMAGAAESPALPLLSYLTWPGMWLYFVLPTFAFPGGGNERASVPPIYGASREPHGCRKSRCLLLNLACCYVNLLPALMSPINTPCVSNKLAFLSLELLKADLCQICPWARPGLRRG